MYFSEFHVKLTSFDYASCSKIPLVMILKLTVQLKYLEHTYTPKSITNLGKKSYPTVQTPFYTSFDNDVV